jgi:N-acetylglucosamine-6-phosphate deacetylase
MILRGVERLAASGICPLQEAWELASVRPAALLGLPAAKGLKVGAPADLVVLRETEGKLEVVETHKSGIRVFRRS